MQWPPDPSTGPTGHHELCRRPPYDDVACERCGWKGCSCRLDYSGYGEKYCPVCVDEL